MHIVVLSHSLPQPSSNGGPMTCWAIMKQVLERGHRTTVVSLQYPEDPFVGEDRQQLIREQGADLVVVPTDDARAESRRRAGLLDSNPRAAFPSSRLMPRMRDVLDEIHPDAMFVYHWDTLATVHGLNSVPKVAGVGDPWHLPHLRRWQRTTPRPTPGYVKWSLAVLRNLYVYPRAMVRLLNDCQAAGCFQAREAAWLRDRGAQHCEYWPSPIADVCGSEWQARREAAVRTGAKPKILLGPSSLEVTSTSSGLRFFATQILPALERELGPDGFEVHIVGDGKPVPELARLLPRPTVVMRGRVEPADDEFLSCAVQLVPTPFVLGIRLRIVAGLSFGCCVVAHTAEAANIPELKHDHNALLSPTGSGLAEQVVRIIRDPELRERLGANGRQTYDEVFHPSKAAAPIVEKLEEVALRGSK